MLNILLSIKRLQITTSALIYLLLKKKKKKEIKDIISLFVFPYSTISNHQLSEGFTIEGKMGARTTEDPGQRQPHSKLRRAGFGGDADAFRDL